MKISFKSIKIDVKQQEIGATNIGLFNTPIVPFSAETPITIHEQIAALHINTPTNHNNGQHSPVLSSLQQPSNTMHTNSPQSYSVERTLRKQGYMPLQQYTTTLQGSIWKVLRRNGNNNNQETQIVKVTNKSLHKKSIAYVNGKSYIVAEDIEKETAMLHYLTNNQAPIGLAKYKNCFVDKYNYFLVQEDAGQVMFNIVKSSHDLIKKQLIDITEWHRFCKNAMKQMLNVLDWLHNEMHSTHMDISLENWTIKNLTSTMKICHNKSTDAQRKIEFSSNFTVKIIDFGVAELFTKKKSDGSIDFSCNKYVGKTSYKAPKVYGKKQIFDARLADCFSLGVCFCMMFIGVSLWQKPSNKDASFRYIMSGQYKIFEVIESWGLLNYVSVEILDLLIGLFSSENHRLTIKQVKQHCWFTTT